MHKFGFLLEYRAVYLIKYAYSTIIVFNYIYLQLYLIVFVNTFCIGMFSKPLDFYMKKILNCIIYI